MLIAVCKKWHKSSEVDQNVVLKFLLDGPQVVSQKCNTKNRNDQHFENTTKAKNTKVGIQSIVLHSSSLERIANDMLFLVLC